MDIFNGQKSEFGIQPCAKIFKGYKEFWLQGFHTIQGRVVIKWSFY